MKLRFPIAIALGGVILSMIGLALQNKFNNGDWLTYGGLSTTGYILDLVYFRRSVCT